LSLLFQDYKSFSGVEGYILTFSITEHTTFQYVHDLVYEIRQEQGSSKAVIVVANKSDLVRSRAVTEEGSFMKCFWGLHLSCMQPWSFSMVYIK
jgi:GTPase SAR1 family protein